jgi:hypothetical protein
LSRFVEQASRLKKRSQLFISMHNETLSIVALRGSNEDCPPVALLLTLLTLLELCQSDSDNGSKSGSSNALARQLESNSKAFFK